MITKIQLIMDKISIVIVKGRPDTSVGEGEGDGVGVGV